MQEMCEQLSCCPFFLALLCLCDDSEDASSCQVLLLKSKEDKVRKLAMLPVNLTPSPPLQIVLSINE